MAKIQRRTLVAIPDDPTYAISSDEWNDSLIVTGGTDGQAMVRDSSAPDGWSLQTISVTPAPGSITNAMLAGSITASNLIRTDLVLAQSQITNLTTDLAALTSSLATKAPLVSPAFSTSISVGANPATTGAIRLANNTGIVWRNAANTADIIAMAVDGTNTFTILASIVQSSFAGSNLDLTAQGAAAIRFSVNGTAWWSINLAGTFFPVADNANQFGTSSNRISSLYVGTSVVNSGYYEGAEMTAPAAPAADKGRIFFQDNGSGKTQLMVRFNTGTAVQIAIQP